MYVPAEVKVNENVPPGVIGKLSNAPLSSVAVWSVLSVLVQTTVSPASIVRLLGLNPELPMLMLCVVAPAVHSIGPDQSEAVVVMFDVREESHGC